ncbi:MAG: HAMP domain-containing protein [Oligoflexia bacterium]|nr:HAMP domain-containing protein [Oligoflexia bacterium]
MLNPFENFSLKAKLMTSILTAFFLGIVTVVGVNYFHFKKILEDRVKEQIEVVQKSRLAQLESYLGRVGDDFASQAKGRLMADMFVVFQGAVLAEGHSGMEDATYGEVYKKSYDKHHPRLKQLADNFNYRNLIMVNNQSQVIYSSLEGGINGKNFTYGAMAGSAYSECFEQGQSKLTFFDYFYDENSGRASAILCVPVISEFDRTEEGIVAGATIGVMIAELSNEHIEKILQGRNGLGKTGYTFLIGPDYSLRSDYKTAGGSYLLNYWVKSKEKNNLTHEYQFINFKESPGKTEVLLGKNLFGEHVLRSYTILEFQSQKWGFVIELPTKEIFAQVNNLLLSTIGIAIVIALGMCALFILLINSITNPLIKLTHIANKMANGDYDQKIDINRSDEVGFLANSFQSMSKAITKRDKELAELNAGLERQVEERTFELKEALKSVSNLLNNMRQAVFTVTSDGTIMSPVSQYSNSIFKENIKGKSVFDTVYRNLDRKQEQYAYIKSNMHTAFGEGELQWELSVDYFPSRIVYKYDDKHEEQILKLSYNPIWDQNNNLEKLMFVIEDITEFEKLEAEMVKQKEEVNRKIIMLQELASNKVENLQEFFESAEKMISESIDVAKRIRNQFMEGREVDELQLLFRILHTIKGNARVFGLSFISSMVHSVESIITGINNPKSENDKMSKELLVNLVDGIRLIRGQINGYRSLAKEVFKMKLGSDEELLSSLDAKLKVFENSISLLIGGAFRGKGFPIEGSEKIENIYANIRGNQEKAEIIERIQHNIHSCKGDCIGLNRKTLATKLTQFELSLDKINSSEEIGSKIFEEIFLKLLSEIQIQACEIFTNSSNFSALSTNFDYWIGIFSCQYRLSLAYDKLVENKGDEKEEANFIEQVHCLSTFFNEIKASHLINILKVIMELYDKKSYSPISTCLGEIWVFLAMVSQFNLGSSSNKKERQQIIELLTDPCASEIHVDLANIYLLTSLNILKREGVDKQQFFKTFAKYVRVAEEDAIRYFVPLNDTSYVATQIFFTLKNTYNLECLRTMEVVTKDKDSVLNVLVDRYLQREDLPNYVYLRFKTLIKLACAYADIAVDEQINEGRPQTLEILASNFDSMKNYLLEFQKKMPHEEFADVDKKFLKLLELPVKHSINKFRSVVKEVSKDLKKNIGMKLSGDQCSLERNRLYLLQDCIMHLVRNALDHGIEMPEQRVKMGKEEKGIIEINCKDMKDKIEIVIKDDGAGVNVQRVCLQAVKKGILSKEQIEQLDEKGKLELIFHSGLSTKDEVSEISGRGVGMDVVRKNLSKLNGGIEVETTEGEGTKFTLTIAV